MLRAAIDRPIAISMLFLALVIIGVISYTRLGLWFVFEAGEANSNHRADRPA